MGDLLRHRPHDCEGRCGWPQGPRRWADWASGYFRGHPAARCGQRDCHLASSTEHRAGKWVLRFGSLEQRIELLGQHEKLIVEPHEHIMLHEAGRRGWRIASHLIDHEPRPPLERQLLAEHRCGAGEPDP